MRLCAEDGDEDSHALKKVAYVVCTVCCLTLGASAAAPVSPTLQLDFFKPGSLRVMRGAFRDGGEQITFGPDGATVKLGPSAIVLDGATCATVDTGKNVK